MVPKLHVYTNHPQKVVNVQIPEPLPQRVSFQTSREMPGNLSPQESLVQLVSGFHFENSSLDTHMLT